MVEKFEIRISKFEIRTGKRTINGNKAKQKNFRYSKHSYPLFMIYEL